MLPTSPEPESIPLRGAFALLHNQTFILIGLSSDGEFKFMTTFSAGTRDPIGIISIFKGISF